MSETSPERVITYRCVAGHEVPAAELEALTVQTALDGGAEVRICREHGAPIAQRIRWQREHGEHGPTDGGI